MNTISGTLNWRLGEVSSEEPKDAALLQADWQSWFLCDEVSDLDLVGVSDAPPFTVFPR